MDSNTLIIFNKWELRITNKCSPFIEAGVESLCWQTVPAI